MMTASLELVSVEFPVFHLLVMSRSSNAQPSFFICFFCA